MNKYTETVATVRERERERERELHFREDLGADASVRPKQNNIRTFEKFKM